MLRYAWLEFLSGVKKSRFIIVTIFMLYFSCVSVVHGEAGEGVWRFQNVVQMFCIFIIFGEPFQYHIERTIPRVFFYVPRKIKGGGERLRSYIRFRCAVEITTFVLLSLGVDGITCLYNQIIQHRHIYLGVPQIQLLQFLLFVLCLIYFRVGAFHKALLQRWMFRGRGQLIHFGMVVVTVMTFGFTEIIIDSAINGLIPSAMDMVILGVVVLLCLLHTLYFSHRCIAEMSMTEVQS